MRTAIFVIIGATVGWLTALVFVALFSLLMSLLGSFVIEPFFIIATTFVGGVIGHRLAKKRHVNANS